MTRQRPKTFESKADPLDNVADFQPTVVRPKPDLTEAEKAAKASGFTAREGQGTPTPEKRPIDARSLRKTNRTAQLNISVSPETKGRFWQFAVENDCQTGEAALLFLLDSK